MTAYLPSCWPSGFTRLADRLIVFYPKADFSLGENCRNFKSMWAIRIIGCMLSVIRRVDIKADFDEHEGSNTKR